MTILRRAILGFSRKTEPTEDVRDRDRDRDRDRERVEMIEFYFKEFK